MSHWKRPATKTYDYNFKLGEHYYKPQLDYLDSRKGRAKTPPTAKTFAERFVDDPIYGRYGGISRRTAAGAVDTLGESSNLNRFASLDELNLKSSLSGALTPTSPRLIVGDRILDSVGVKESQLSAALNLNSSLSSSSNFKKQSEEGQSSSSSLLSRRKVGFAQSAQSDLTDDPFKSSSTSSKLQAARKQADEMMQEMQDESDSTVSRFRARTQARKQEQSLRMEQQSISNSNLGFSDDEETAALRFRVNEIGNRAKARLAALEDDFPDIQIGSSLAQRRAANNASSTFYANDDDSSSQLASSKTVKVTKRTVKASYEVE